MIWKPDAPTRSVNSPALKLAPHSRRRRSWQPKATCKSLRYAENHIRAMRECNDCIDDLTRQLEGLK
jgi:hypothetical protein